MASPSTTMRRLFSVSCWQQRESDSTLPANMGANGVHSWEEGDEQDTSGSETCRPGGSSKDLAICGSLSDDSDSSDEDERDDRTSESGTDSVDDSDSSDEVEGNNESSDADTDSDRSSDSNNNNSRSEDSDSTDESGHDNITNKCDQSFNLLKHQRSVQMLPTVSVSPIVHGSPVPWALRAIHVFYRQFLEEKGQSLPASDVWCGKVRKKRGSGDLGEETIGESEANNKKNVHPENQRILGDFLGPVHDNQFAGNRCVAKTVSEDGGKFNKKVDTSLNKVFQQIKRSESECPQEVIRTAIGDGNFELSIGSGNDSTYGIKECNSATKSCDANKDSNKHESFEGARYFSVGKRVDKIFNETDKPSMAVRTSLKGVCESLDGDQEGFSFWDCSQDVTDAREGREKTCDPRTTAYGTHDRQKCEVFYPLREVERGTDHFNSSDPDCTSISKGDVAGHALTKSLPGPAPSSHQTSKQCDTTTCAHQSDCETSGLDTESKSEAVCNMDTRNSCIELCSVSSVRKQSSFICGKECSCVSSGREQSSSICGKECSCVSSGREQASSICRKECSCVSSGREQASSICGKECSCVSSGWEQASSICGNECSSVSSGREQASSICGKEHCSVSSGREPASSICGKEHCSVSSGREQASSICGKELCSVRSGREHVLSISDKEHCSVSSGQEPVSSISGKEHSSVSSGLEQATSTCSQELRLSSGSCAVDLRHSVAGACEQSCWDVGGKGDDHRDGGSEGRGSRDDSEGDDGIAESALNDSNDESEKNSDSEVNSSSESEENSSDCEGSSSSESEENCSCEFKENCGQRESEGCVNDERIINQEESEDCSEEKSNKSCADNEYEHNYRCDFESRYKSIAVGTSSKNVSHLILDNTGFGADCKALGQKCIDDSVQRTRVEVRNEHSPCKVEPSHATAVFNVKLQQQDKGYCGSLWEENVTHEIKLKKSVSGHEISVKLNFYQSNGGDCPFPLDHELNDKQSPSNVAFTEPYKPRELVADSSCSQCTFTSESKSVTADSAQNSSESDEINRNRHLIEARTVPQLVPSITDTNSTPDTHSIRAGPASEYATANDVHSDCETSSAAEDCDGNRNLSCSSDTHNIPTDEDEARTRSILGLRHHGQSVSSDSARDFMDGSEGSEQFWSSDSDEYEGYRSTNKYDINDTNLYLEHSLFKFFDGQCSVDVGDAGENGNEGKPRELRCAGCDRVLTMTVYSHLMRSKKCQGSYDMERVKLLHFEMMRLKKNTQNRYYNQRKLASPSHRDTTKTTCLGCNKKFVAILQHLIRSVSCRDHYDYEALVNERNKRSEENRAENRKRYSETLRQERLPQNEAVLEECQGCGKKFVSLLKHLANAKNCPEVYGGREKVAAIASERRKLREQAYDRKKYLKMKEIICEKQRQYHHEHRDQIRVAKQRYRKMNREENRVRARGYYKQVKDMIPEERERRRKQALERCHRRKALAKGDCSTASQSKKLYPEDQDASIFLNLTVIPRLKRNEPSDRRDEVKSKTRNTCNGLTAEPSDLRSSEHQRFSKEMFCKINGLRQEPPTIKEEDNDGEVSSIAEVKVEPENASDNNEHANEGVRSQDNSSHQRLTKSTKSRKKASKKNITKQKDIIEHESSKDADHIDDSSVALITGAGKPNCERIALKRIAADSQGSEKFAQVASARDAQSARDCAFATNVLTPNCSHVTRTKEDTRRRQFITSQYAGLGEASIKSFTHKGTSIRKGNAPRIEQTGMMSCIVKDSSDFSVNQLHKPVAALRAERDGTTVYELCALEHWSEAASLPSKYTSGKEGGLKRTRESCHPLQFKTIKKRKM